MKASLNVRLGQHLSLAPQLQQAIRLLQLSALDLQQEIQQNVETNPLLEVDESAQSLGVSSIEQMRESCDSGQSSIDVTEQQTYDLRPANVEPVSSSAANTSESVKTEAVRKDGDVTNEDQFASMWQEENYQFSGSRQVSYSDEDTDNFEAFYHTEETLHDHLIWQMELTPFTKKEIIIAEMIIDAINEDGYLLFSIDDIHKSLLKDKDLFEDADDTEEIVEVSELLSVLNRIQSFEPSGVGARNLIECLLIQLNHLPNSTPLLEPTKIIVEHHLNEVARGEDKKLKRICKLSDEQFKIVVRLIHQLHPHPGAEMAGSNVNYVVPDVIVTKEQGEWRAHLNRDVSPRLNLNYQYLSMIKRADNSRDNAFLRENLREARWFLKSLANRNDTLLKVTASILKRQNEFFENGETAMRPMVLQDVADEIEMHESTVSRITTQKYMYTPRGVFELKYFFSSHVNSSDGGVCSSTAIRAMIKRMISEEDRRKPLSDNKLTKLLEEQGIKVARRTVAKYRESMRILSSNERRQMSHKL